MAGSRKDELTDIEKFEEALIQVYQNQKSIDEKELNEAQIALNKLLQTIIQLADQITNENTKKTIARAQYLLARYYAANKDNKNCVLRLEQAVTNGDLDAKYKKMQYLTEGGRTFEIDLDKAAEIYQELLLKGSKRFDQKLKQYLKKHPELNEKVSKKTEKVSNENVNVAIPKSSEKNVDVDPRIKYLAERFQEQLKEEQLKEEQFLYY